MIGSPCGQVTSLATPPPGEVAFLAIYSLDRSPPG